MTHKILVEITIDDEYLHTMMLINRASSEPPCHKIPGDRPEMLRFWGLATFERVGSHTPERFRYALTPAGLDIFVKLSSL